jgi:hypothetical protein
MTHVDDDNIYKASALIEGGNALAAAIAERYPDSETVMDWRELLAGDDEPTDELVTQLVKQGKILRFLAADWLDCPEAIEETLQEQFREAINLWDTIQCDPEGGGAVHC